MEKLSMIEIPTSKKKYREKSIKDLDASNPNVYWMPKVDGAHNILVLEGKKPKVYSHRISKKDGKQISHTAKHKKITAKFFPEEFDGTAVRGESYITDPKTGKSQKAQIIAGILNSKTEKSLEDQKEKGNLKFMAFDIDKYKGKDVSELPFSEKYEKIKKVVEALNNDNVTVAEVAKTQTEKEMLLRKIRGGDYKLTQEGIIEVDPKSSGFTKAPIKKTYDYYVSGVYHKPKTHEKGQVAGLELATGPGKDPIAIVGTGLSERQRKLFFKNPGLVRGLVAKIQAKGRFKSGKLEKPSFKGFHESKSNPVKLRQYFEKLKLKYTN